MVRRLRASGLAQLSRSRFADLKDASSPLSVSTRIAGLLVDETAPNAETLFDAAGPLAPPPIPSQNFSSASNRIKRRLIWPWRLSLKRRVLKPWALTVPVGEQQITVERALPGR